MKALGILVAVVVLVGVGYVIYGMLQGERAPEPPPISIVYLLQAPRQVSEDSIRDAVSKAFGITFDVDNDDATEFVLRLPPPRLEGLPVGKAECFIVQVRGGTYMINNFAIPYVDNPEEFAKEFVDGRLRRVLGSHRAWFSVDAMGDIKDAESKANAYRDIARILAEFAGPDCLAIYCPELERCNEYDDEILEKLRSDDPLSVFEAPTFAPVIGVADDDPKMVKAVAEARKRWPEFAAAFRARVDSETPFAVKAAFREGDLVEFMWISVTRIDDEAIHGILENMPNELTGVKVGQEVVVPLSDLNDGLYARDGETVGGFTLKVIQEVGESR